MTEKEKREQVVQMIANLMRTTPFSVEWRVKKKPKGIKVVIEMTQEEMNCLIGNAAKKQLKTTTKKQQLTYENDLYGCSRRAKSTWLGSND